MDRFNLGNAYRLGEGVKVDVTRALGHFERSFDLDSAKGCTELAVLYYEGKVVPKDVDRAITLLGKSCKLGNEVGCKKLQILRSLPRVREQEDRNARPSARRGRRPLTAPSRARRARSAPNAPGP
jgi:TPR repeat protein